MVYSAEIGSIPTEQSAPGFPHQQPKEHANGRPAQTGSLSPMRLRVGVAYHGTPITLRTDSGR